MAFDAVYCFSEVVIFQSHLNGNAARMDGTMVMVENSDTGDKNLCGTLAISNDLTIEGQTYVIPCDLKCGNSILLEVNHGWESSIEGCIHLREIQAYIAAGL